MEINTTTDYRNYLQKRLFEITNDEISSIYFYLSYYRYTNICISGHGLSKSNCDRECKYLIWDNKLDCDMNDPDKKVKKLYCEFDLIIKSIINFCKYQKEINQITYLIKFNWCKIRNIQKEINTLNN